jgi:AbrB family looped-hinge helix DNA binding protein
VVIPKALREEAGLAAGVEVEVTCRNGRVEIEPTAVSVRLVRQEGQAKIAAETEMPVLTSDAVRDVLERARR